MKSKTQLILNHNKKNKDHINKLVHEFREIILAVDRLVGRKMMKPYAVQFVMDENDHLFKSRNDDRLILLNYLLNR